MIDVQFLLWHNILAKQLYEEKEMPSVKLIKTTLEDIKDYMRFRQEEANKFSLTKTFNYFFKKDNIHSETEANYAQKSFNEFIKYRYYTSKLDADSVLEEGVNYIADISFLDLSEGINLEDADFSNTYAIGTNFSNCSLHCANFKSSILPLATFDKSVVAYADFTNAVLSYSNVGSNYGALIAANTVVVGLNGQFAQMQDLALPNLQDINIVDALSRNTLKAIHGMHEQYETMGNRVVNSVNTVANGVGGVLIGGLGGFTITNLSLAALAPAVGFPVAINLSMAGSVLGAMEGFGYKLGYNSSIINAIFNKIHSVYKPINDAAITEHLLIEKDGFADVKIIEAGSMDSVTLELLVNYSALPVFKFGDINGDWEMVENNYVLPIPELLDDNDFVMIESPVELAISEEQNDELSWEIVDFSS